LKIAARVRELRERQMLSQQELAEKMGVSLFTVQRIERGEGGVRPSTGRKLAAALRVEPEELLVEAAARDAPKAPQEELLFYDTAGLARAMNLDPEPEFAELAIVDEAIRALYEAAYLRLLRAEHRQAGGHWEDRFDTELSDHALRLSRAVNTLPPGKETQQLSERASSILRRTAAVFMREAEHTETRLRELRHAGEALIGAA
jgi:transcriptional regulator with XRE-family HTH domain